MNRLGDVARDLLRAAGWPGEGRQPGPGALPEMLEKLGGSLGRMVPPLPRRHVDGNGEGQARLLLLDSDVATVYRVNFEFGGDDDVTVGAERLDLTQVVRVTVSESHYMGARHLVLKYRWCFEFATGDPLEIEDEQVSPGYEAARGAYTFARAVAEAAGWAPVQPTTSA